jgi:hypothetical protein
MLVCIAVWLSVAARSVEGKVIAIAFPISAFVTLGFEHCIANFYLLPIGMLSGAQVTGADFLANIVPVTLGNTVGGIIISATWYLIYLGKSQPQGRAAANAPAEVASAPAASSVAPKKIALVERPQQSVERASPSTERPMQSIGLIKPAVITRPVSYEARPQRARA